MATYVDNAIPFGSFSIELLRSGAPLGTYILEQITVTRPTKIVERPNAIGGDNGWAAIPTFITGSGTIQVPTTDSEYPDIGDYFLNDFGYGEERFVITEVGQPFAISDYYKCNVNFRKSANPPA